jgi:hypothetical protein
MPRETGDGFASRNCDGHFRPPTHGSTVGLCFSASAPPVSEHTRQMPYRTALTASISVRLFFTHMLIADSPSNQSCTWLKYLSCLNIRTPSINFINFIIGGCSKSRTTRENNEDMVHTEKKEQAKISK